MDAVTDPEIPEIAVMKSSQGGWTEIINNVVGYFIDQDPAPILVIQPTLSVGKAWSNDRLSPMIRDTPSLAAVFDQIRSRDKNNTQLYKKFPGGHVTIAGANSPASLSSRPIRVVLGDEVDRYPASAGDEGDPLTLAFRRSTNFWNRKRLSGSTPTIAGASRIEEKFEQSDKRYFFVPCPDCGEHQVLKWAQVNWTDSKPSTARYACISCGVLWDDGDRNEAVRLGEWRATAPFTGIAGFHFWQAYSPWTDLEEIVSDWLAAQGNAQRLKVFVNTTLAETWKEKGEAPEWRRLYDRAEDYPIGSIPDGVMFLTAGVDVQKDRLEVSIWGWGRGVESWLIDHRVLSGDPYKADVWDALDKIVGETWNHPGGADLSLVKVAIDSGYATLEVYKFIKRHRPDIVFAVKGVDRGSAGVGLPKKIDVTTEAGKKKKRRGGEVWPVVGAIYKSELYGFFGLDAPTRESGEAYPEGYVHLAKFPDEVFKQIAAEQLVTRVVRFQRRTEWEKTRERNEVLDCRVYARAAAAVYGLDRFTDKHWQIIGDHLKSKQIKPAKRAGTPQPAVQPTALGAGWIKRRGNWLRGRS